jgi:outer membrane receptor protein involved in Fe transport
LFFIWLFTFGLATSQTSRGTVTGRVVDSSGAILQGAKIHLEPRSLTLASDAQGEFGITDLTPGAYKVTISYVGFSPFETDVAVVAGEIQHVNARLAVTSTSEQVIVTAEWPRGEAESINRTRMADNILQVLPAEVITSLPNANVADALGRLPSVTLERIEGEGVYVQVRSTEPRLTNVMINGISVPAPEPGVRQVRLDTIPADLVESVEINKTLAPNLDGDGIGGSVNLKTKTAGEFPTLNLYGIGGYDPILGGVGNDQLGGTIGHRFGKEKKLGILFGGSYDYNGRGINNLQPGLIRCPPSASQFTITTLFTNIDITEIVGVMPAQRITNSANSPAFISKAFTQIFRTMATSGTIRR